ncbi:MAG: bifunctional phosphopantothenoylcysteine decarboxylase/phosphopantothenate--cysteine ligase CoaBC [Thermoplasmata archaeon]
MIPYDKNSYARMLEGKTVIIGTTASISIYRIPDLIRDLRREGASVIVGMSSNSSELVDQEVMKWASENEVVTKITGYTEHINLFLNEPEKKVLVIAPASYDTIGKIAGGITDTIPTLFFSFAFGHGVKTVIAPAMHRSMMENPINIENVNKLKNLGIDVVDPIYDDEKAKLSTNAIIMDHVCRSLYSGLHGKSVLIVSGHGDEPIDPVRSISNGGTGYTGYWLSKIAYRMGASRVTYVGNSVSEIPEYVNYIETYRMDDFERKTIEEIEKGYDIVIVSASLSDFAIDDYSDRKISSDSALALKMKPRKKLTDQIRERFNGKLVVFRLTDDINEDASSHFKSKPDMIVINSYRKNPFGKTTNSYRIIYEGKHEDYSDLPKPLLALKIMEMLVKN